MAPKDIKFDILGGYEKQEHNELDPQQTINLFPIHTAEGKKALFPTPGLNLDNGVDFSKENNGGGRAQYVFNNKLFAVIKNKVYRLTASSKGLDHAEIGEIETNSGFVDISSLENQLMFIDGIGGWIWDKNSLTFTKITDPNFPAEPISTNILANRFIVQKADRKNSFYSDSGDGLSWNVLNEIAFTSGDINVGAATLDQRLYVMGEKSIEPWYAASGATLTPFRRSDPTIDFGCAAPGSIVSDLGVMVWLSRTDKGVGSIMATSGGRPTPISDQSIETAIAKFDVVSDAEGYIYKNEIGHVMYVLSFTDANKTFMYDFNTKKSSLLEYGAKKQIERHLSQSHVYFNGKHYVLDYKNPYLYEMSDAYGTDNGVTIRRARISSILEAPANHEIIVNNITPILKQGIGGDCGVDENPTVFLEVSLDEGESYGNQLPSEIGRIGRRRWESFFEVFNSSRSFVFKLEYYESKPFVVTSCDIDFEVKKVR